MIEFCKEGVAISKTNPTDMLQLPAARMNLATEAAVRDDTWHLTRALAAGEEEAFRKMHAFYFDRLYRFLLVVARGNEIEAREALQDTLLRIVRHPRIFSTEEAFWCWLKVLARSAARDAGRKHQRYGRFLERFAWYRSFTEEQKRPPERANLMDLLEEALTGLDACDRLLVESKYLEGYTVKHLAQEYNLTEKAVESRLHRIRRQLRACLLQLLKSV